MVTKMLLRLRFLCPAAITSWQRKPGELWAGMPSTPSYVALFGSLPALKRSLSCKHHVTDSSLLVAASCAACQDNARVKRGHRPWKRPTLPSCGGRRVGSAAERSQGRVGGLSSRLGWTCRKNLPRHANTAATPAVRFMGVLHASPSGWLLLPMSCRPLPSMHLRLSLQRTRGSSRDVPCTHFSLESTCGGSPVGRESHPTPSLHPPHLCLHGSASQAVVNLCQIGEVG